MRLTLVLLLLLGLSMAFTVRPHYLETKDTGSGPAMDVGITIDCTTKAVTVDVKSDLTGEPVEGAKTYMFYTDYSYQALPNPGTTDGSGTTVMAVPGNINYLTALFILRTDRSGYQSREIEYTYEDCFKEPPADQGQAPPPQAANETSANETAPSPDNATATTEPPPPQDNQTGQAPPAPEHNASATSPAMNESGGTAGESDAAPPSACPAGLVLLWLLALRVRP
jgi:hypothetical protein